MIWPLVFGQTLVGQQSRMSATFAIGFTRRSCRVARSYITTVIACAARVRPV